jgi:FKBP-type peptidyl-prolyl cis-trans isomerase SlyD
VPYSRHSRAIAALVTTALLVLGVSAAGAEEADEVVIHDGSKVGFEYTLKLDDGQIVDSSEGRAPFTYQHGEGQIPPALEAQLGGLHVGSEKQVTLTPEEGYGPVRPELMQTVPIDQIPEDARKVGAQLVSRNEQGQERPLKVAEVRDEEIVLDLNHPLAGQTLHFDIKIVSIE